MANTRINALTTATASAADDYFVIDGATNASRKLSAYTPSVSTITTAGAGTIGGNLTVGSSKFVVTAATGATAIAGDVTLASTTTSNSAITGALVVAGGVGIGGSVNITDTLGVAGNTTLQGSVLWPELSGGGVFNFINGSTVSKTVRIGIGNTNQVLITDTGTTIIATTDSTTKDTGALVIEGGLGVEKAIVTGGAITTAAPTTGTAGAWKLGIRVAATTTLDTTQYIQLDVGGTLYKVALVTS